MSNQIELTESVYTPLEAGKYIFTIEEIEYNPAFKKIEMRLVTETGRKLYQNYWLETKDNRPNSSVLNIFSRLAKAALNDKNAKSVDPDILKGKLFKAEVTHSERPDHPGNPYVNLKNFEPVVAETKVAISDDDLDALLG